MNRLRFVAVAAEPRKGSGFYWVLLESFDDSPSFQEIGRSDLTFTTRGAALEAGCSALRSYLDKAVLDDPSAERT
jgi:hypothetical protein